MLPQYRPTILPGYLDSDIRIVAVVSLISPILADHASLSLAMRSVTLASTVMIVVSLVLSLWSFVSVMESSRGIEYMVVDDVGPACLRASLTSSVVLCVQASA